ncbi:glycerate kinase, partial [Burkholderia pseudomallei]|nr:glycerate kinase [Burkholderia pseudomallei]MBF3605470.1 glycerate kinase [Burkholderia pseudomallei]
RACTIDEALRDAAANVRFAARNVAAAIRVGLKLGRHASSRRLA